MADLPKNSNPGPIAGGGSGRHNLHRVRHTNVTSLPRVGCVFWSCNIVWHVCHIVAMVFVKSFVIIFVVLLVILLPWCLSNRLL